jgi:hypothetical protein
MGKVWNSTLNRYKPLPKATKPLPRATKAIAKVSKSRAVKLRVYEQNKAEYLADNSVCEFPGCERTDVTLHHKIGRVGDLLTDKKHFCALCLEHHMYCEENPNIAKYLNLSGSRLSKL